MENCDFLTVWGRLTCRISPCCRNLTGLVGSVDCGLTYLVLMYFTCLSFYEVFNLELLAFYNVLFDSQFSTIFGDFSFLAITGG